jgi:hypothetical protein
MKEYLAFLSFVSSGPRDDDPLPSVGLQKDFLPGLVGPQGNVEEAKGGSKWWQDLIEVRDFWPIRDVVSC